MVPALAQQTIKRVSAGLESGESAGLSEIVELIQQLSSNALETSVQELASLIGKDIVVTAKVITAANTIGYNPSGIEVSTLTQAIQVIGFNKIRQLAISLLLIETAERTLNPQEKREIAALALCSGLMAESVMNRHGSHAPEHAFVCASLRNYGRLLMSTFMLSEYRQARNMATTGLAEDEAFNRVFGLTPLELGYHLLASAHLPDPILKSLRDLPPDALRKAAQFPDVELLILADMSVKVCELALRPDLNVAEFERNAAAISNRSGRAFGLDFEGLLGMLGEAGEQLNNFANTFGLRSLAETVTTKIQARVKHEEPFALPTARAIPGIVKLEAPASTPATTERGTSVPPVPPSTPAAPPTAPIPVANAKTPATPPTATPIESTGTPPEAAAEDPAFKQAFELGIEQLAGFLDEDPVNMLKVYRSVLKAATQGFASSNTLLFIREKSGRPFIVEQGSGHLFETIRGQSLVNENDRNVFGVCLQRLEDVLIYNAADPKIIPHLPAWIKSSRIGSFVLLPIHENRRPFALLMAAWPEKRASVFTGNQIRQVRSMLKLVGTARRLSATD